MGICAEELRSYVIQPTLEYLGESSEAAENLLLGTAAQESELGFHLQQGAKNQGIGIFQISPEQHRSIWDNYLVRDPDLASKVRGLASQREFLTHPDAELATNLSYATAIAWMLYRQQGVPLPAAGDITAMAERWRSCFHPGCDCDRHFEECYRSVAANANDTASVSLEKGTAAA